MEGYGLTETSPATNVNLPLEVSDAELPFIPSRRFGTVGPPLPGVAIRITNPATEQETSSRSVRNYLLKGANIFNGYLDEPELTEKVDRRNRWFKTGDVGRIDEDGFLVIEGRISRFSKIAGEMVPHETIEAAVNRILGLTTKPSEESPSSACPTRRKEKRSRSSRRFPGKRSNRRPSTSVTSSWTSGFPPSGVPSASFPLEPSPSSLPGNWISNPARNSPPVSLNAGKTVDPR